MPDDRLARICAARRPALLDTLRERAAIAEYDGELLRQDAEAVAWRDLCTTMERRYRIITTPGELAAALRR